MALYRALKTVGFQVCLINVVIDASHTARCGLVFLGANLGTLPLKLTDLDSGAVVGLFVPPEEYQNKPSHTWLHSSIDDIQLQIIPHEKQSLPDRS